MEQPVNRCQHGVWLADLCYQCAECFPPEGAPSIPEAKPNTTVGVFVSNPAWRRYMRKEDTWEGKR